MFGLTTIRQNLSSPMRNFCASMPQQSAPNMHNGSENEVARSKPGVKNIPLNE